MSTARGEAHGKVILFGEHAVVHGAPAIAAGISRGARAEAAVARDGKSLLRVGGRRVVPAEHGGNLERAFAGLLGALPGALPARVTAESALPSGGGLGSSAALGVAIARAVAALGGRVDPAHISAAALAWERIFHGNPSGIDTAAAALGGCFRYRRVEGAPHPHPGLRADEPRYAPGPEITPIPLRQPLWLCVGLTGVSSSTRLMVEGVARLFERKPEIRERTLPAITAVVQNAALAIEAGDLVGLGRLMDLNHMLLSTLLVSTGELEELCDLARKAGALGAKLTGAGGGGSMIALLPARTDAEADAAAAPLLAAWRAAAGSGYAGFLTRIGAPPPAGEGHA